MAAERTDDEAQAASTPVFRGPRTVEPPPRNPNVFSFTYTLWKTAK